MKKLILLFTLTFSLINVCATNNIDSNKTSDSIMPIIDTMINAEGDSVLIDVPLETTEQSRLVVMNNNDDNLWVSVGLPILTLLLGIAIPLIIEGLSKRRKSRKVLKRWVAEIRSLESPMQKQIAANEKFIAEQSEATFEINAPTIYAILNCNIFKTMDKGEFLQAIESIKKIEYKEAVRISNSTHGYINILTNNHEVLGSKFQEYLDESSRHIRIFNDHFDELQKAFGNYGVELEKSTGQDPYQTNAGYKQIADLFSVHVIPKMESGDYNPFELDKHFFRPLLVTLSHLRLDERINPLTQYTSKCIRSIKAIRMERRYIAINMQQVADKYKQELIALPSIVQPLEK